MNKPLLRKLVKNFGKVILITFLVIAVFYSHREVYREGYTRGIGDGQDYAATYVYNTCNSEHNNKLKLYGTVFYCCRLDTL